METYWDVIKAFYQQKFNIPPQYIDYIACEKLLLDCVSGYGNKTISRRHKLPIDYVKDVIIDFLGFPGFDIDLDISPIALYNLSNKNLLHFQQNVVNHSAYLEYEDAKFLFKICRKFDKLRSWATEVEKEIK
jgi:hypothetical protein